MRVFFSLTLGGIIPTNGHNGRNLSRDNKPASHNNKTIELKLLQLI